MYKKRHIVECKADMKQVSIDHVFLLVSINLTMVDKGLGICECPVRQCCVTRSQHGEAGCKPVSDKNQHPELNFVSLGCEVYNGKMHT